MPKSRRTEPAGDRATCADSGVETDVTIGRNEDARSTYGRDSGPVGSPIGRTGRAHLKLD